MTMGGESGQKGGEESGQKGGEEGKASLLGEACILRGFPALLGPSSSSWRPPTFRDQLLVL